jgi:protein TonB
MGFFQDLITYFIPGEEEKRFPGIPFVDLAELKILSAPNPEDFYPPYSKHAGEKGKVRLLLSVHQSGKVVSTRIVKSSDFSRLDQAATKLSSQFLFDDYIYNNGPSPFQTSIEIEFR